MKAIADMIVAEENRLFTGRDHELELMRKAFHDDDSGWQMIHLYGPNGMGKSALLRRFSRELTEEQVLYLQPAAHFRDSTHFLEALVDMIATDHPQHKEINSATTLDDVIQSLNRLASDEQRLLLIFDSFEYWDHIRDWLFASFLPRLPLQVRLFTASRQPLYHVNNPSVSWESFVRNVELQPFKHTSIHEYIQKWGIHEPSLRETIARLTMGIPIALNICCRKMMDHDYLVNPINLTRTVHLLCQTVIEEAHLTAEQRKLLIAASLVWRFDKNMLSHIIGQDLDTIEFQQFCHMPIVMIHLKGWSLIDGIRDWVWTVYKNREPDTFQLYKQRAYEVLYQRWLSANETQKAERFVDLLYQVDHDKLKEYYYRGGYTQYETRELTEEQLPIIKNMWRNWFREVPPFQEDHSKQEQYFRAIWRKTPAAFTTFWEQDRLAAFNVVVPLNKGTRDILRDNVPYRYYIINSETVEDEELIWIGAPADRNDLEASSHVFRHFLQQFMRRKLFTLVTPIENHMLSLLALGFVRLSWADYESPSGLIFYVLQLDTREKSLYQQLFDRASYTKTRSAKQLTALIKQLLAHYHQLESNESLMEQLRLSPICTIDHHEEVGAIASHIRHAVQEALHEIAQKSQKNEQVCRILSLFYIEQVGTHEIVADRLHLSISTYYRYLRRAIELLTMYFMKK